MSNNTPEGEAEAAMVVHDQIVNAMRKSGLSSASLGPVLAGILGSACTSWGAFVFTMGLVASAFMGLSRAPRTPEQTEELEDLIKRGRLALREMNT